VAFFDPPKGYFCGKLKGDIMKNDITQSDLRKAVVSKLHDEWVLNLSGKTYYILSEPIDKTTLETIFNKNNNTDLIDKLEVRWASDAFVCPAFVITPEIFLCLMKNEINEPLEVVRHFLHSVNLENEIDTKTFYKHVLCNTKLDTPNKLAYACDLIKTSILDIYVLENLHQFVKKIIDDEDYETMCLNYYHSDHKMDLTKPEENIKRDWQYLSVNYEGSLKMPDFVELVTNTNDLTNFKWNSPSKIDIYRRKMLHHEVFMLKITSKKIDGLLFPVKIDESDSFFILGKCANFVLRSSFQELCRSLSLEIAKQDNQRFFHQNYKFNKEFSLHENRSIEEILSLL
jgi:hypothetical protein